MKVDSEKTVLHFLSGPGEMKERMRAYPWQDHPLGPPATWPMLLQDTLSIVLNASFPMFLYWSQELYCFYNDAFRPSLGKEGKHPRILGQRGQDAWPEIWDTIRPYIMGTLEEGRNALFEDSLIPIYRNGRIENVFWTFGYTPVRDAEGIKGVLVICMETTQRVRKFQNVVESSRAPIAIFKGEDLIIEEANQATLDLWQQDRSVIGQPFLDAVPVMRDQGFAELLLEVYRTGEKRLGFEAPAFFIRGDGSRASYYFNFEFTPYQEASGEVSGVMVISTDVTQQVLAKKQLALAEEEIRTSIDAADLGYWNIDPSSLTFSANKRTRELFGLPMDDTLNLDLALEAIHDEEKAKVRKAIKAALDPMSADKFDIVFRVLHRADGSTRILHARGRAFFDQQKHPIRFSGTVQDITDIRAAEEAMVYREALLEALLRNAPIGFAFFDRQHRYLRINKTLADINGYSVEEHIGKTIMELLPVNAQSVVPMLEKVAVTGEAVMNVEVRGITPRAPGVQRYWLTGFYPVKNYQTDKVDVVGAIVVEITDRKEAEQAIRQSEERFRTLANGIQNLAWLADGDGYVYWYNQRWYEYTGASYEDMEGWGWQRVHHPDHVEKVLEFITEAWKKDEPWELTFPLRRHDGVYRWFLTRAFPVKDAEGRVNRWIGTNTDIDDQKTFTEKLETLVAERTEALQDANRELQRSNQDLQQFAHVASHDLKEPVRKIKIFAGRLRTESGAQLSQQGLLFLDKIESAVERMFAMIEGVLTYSSVNARQKIDEKVDLNLVLQQITDDLEVTIQQKQARVTWEKLPVLKGSSILLYQLFYNLIGNSLKFAQVGIPPVVDISVEPAFLNGNQFFRIRIADNGIGFSQDYAERIFMTFTRLNSKDRYEGTGLGLALCKSIVERHGGTISAESEEGKGAVFTILLPVG